jgi:choloylglycine hydrolase
MRTVKTCYRVIAAVLAVLMSVMLAQAANACSRVTWLGPEGAVITGRSMDWPYSFHSHLYAYPRGLEQNGAGGVNSLKWTTKYGAIVVAGTTEGVMMVESEAKELTEDQMLGAVLFAHDEFQVVINAVADIAHRPFEWPEFCPPDFVSVC